MESVPIVGGLRAYPGHNPWAIGAAVAGFGVFEAVKHASELAAIQSQLRIGGVSEEQIKKATELSFGLGQKYGQPAVTMLKTMSEIRNPLGGMPEAMGHMDTLGQAMTVLRSVDKKSGGNVADQLYDLVRSDEFRNAIHGADFDKGIEMMVRADVATGGKVKPSDFFQFSKYSRASLPGLSDRFLYSYGPELSQEFKGSGAGTVMSGLYQQIVGGMMSTTGLKQMQDLRMLRGGPLTEIEGGKGAQENEFWQFNKFGRVVRAKKPGGIIGSEVFASDPDKFAQIMMEHEAAIGITSPEDQRARNAQIFRRGTTTQFMNVLMQQMLRLDRGAAGIAGTMNLGDMSKTLLATDPETNMRSFSAAWNNLVTALGGPLTKPAISMMQAATEIFQGFPKLSEAMKGIKVHGSPSNVLDDAMKWLGGLGGTAADLPAPNASMMAFHVPGYGLTDGNGNGVGPIHDGVLSALMDWSSGSGAGLGGGGGGYSGGGGWGGRGGGIHSNLRYGHRAVGGGSLGAESFAPAGSLTALINAEALRAGIDPRLMEGIRAGESLHTNRYDIGDGGDSHGPFQLDRAGGRLGAQFERETGLDSRNPKTIPAQARFVAQWIKAHGAKGLGSTWFGYHGPRNADPRWGNSGYVPDLPAPSSGRRDRDPPPVQHISLHVDGQKMAAVVTHHQTKHAWSPRQAPFHDSYGHPTSPDIQFENG
jgi:hypothetical protein